LDGFGPEKMCQKLKKSYKNFGPLFLHELMLKKCRKIRRKLDYLFIKYAPLVYEFLPKIL